MREALDRLDVSGLERQVAAFRKFFELMPSSPAAAMHGTIAQMHALCHELTELPPALWKLPEVQKVLWPATELHMRSRFVSRLLEWPRGYPGDFETVELLVTGSSVPTSSDPGDWIDWYALNTAVAQQHRNKVWWQYLQMCAVTPGRILSVGAGAGVDFNIAPHRFTGSEVVLLDLDQDALRLARERLQRYCDVHTICGDLARGIARAEEDGPFDIVACGGLFDYLDDGTAAMLLRDLRERAVKPSALVVFTNLGEENPFRVWMEAIADWKLVHRSEADLRRIAEEAGFDPLEVRIKRDWTGLTHLVEIGPE
jgi:hypothetical protein